MKKSSLFNILLLHVADSGTPALLVIVETTAQFKALGDRV